MLSKCANLECSEALRFLHQRKAFCLSPTLNLQTAMERGAPVWLARKGGIYDGHRNDDHKSNY
jgi:hypothetical protein